MPPRSPGIVNIYKRSLEVYPSDEFPYRASLYNGGADNAAQHYLPEQIEQIANIPVPLETLARFQVKQNMDDTTIPDHVRLAPSLPVTQSLPVFSLKEAEGRVAPTLSGRKADILLVKKPNGLSKIPDGPDTLSWVDLNEANGDIARQMLSRETPAGRMDRFKGMTSAYAIFEVDPEAPNPLADLESEDAMAGDMRLVDVVTSNQVNTTRMYLLGRTGMRDEAKNIIEWTVDDALSSEISTDTYSTLLERYGSQQALDRIVDGMYVSVGRFWRNNVKRSDDHIPVPDVDHDHAMSILELKNRFMSAGERHDPFGTTSILLRAYVKRLEIEAHARTRGSDKREVQRMTTAIRREVVEALGFYEYLTDREESVDIYNKLPNSQPTEPPVRWKLNVMDDVSRRIAIGMMRTAADPGMKAAGEFYATQIPAHVSLLVMAEGANKLVKLKEKGSDPVAAPVTAYGKDSALPFDGSSGTFPGENRVALFDDVDTHPDFTMDGIAIRMSVMSPQLSIGTARGFWKIDLLKAPAPLLLKLESLGLLDGGHGMDVRAQELYLSDMLSLTSREPVVAAVASDNSNRTAEYIGTIPPNKSVEVGTDKSGKLVLKERPLGDYYQATRAALGSTAFFNGRDKNSRAERRATKGMVVPIRMEDDEKDKAGFDRLTAAAVYAGALYVYRHVNPGKVGGITVMRSERPPQTKIISDSVRPDIVNADRPDIA